MIALSTVLALVLFVILSGVAAAAAEIYCFDNDIPMTEFDWMEVDRWIFSLSALICICAFSILFLSLFSDRIAYIRKITKGIEGLRTGQMDLELPMEGNNELTELAQAINVMSAAQQQLREREQALAREKDQLIRTLSHDIRTPLTSILAYSEYLSAQKQICAEDQLAYVRLIRQKAEQIRELTAVLLDGSKRNLERFENARVLIAQIIAEFESELEDQFQIQTDLSGCCAFSGTFDVQELRRIFDNLSSNIQKYADPSLPVKLSIRVEDQKLLICQSNAVLQPKPQSESYQIGLNSIRRIAQHYAGQVTVQQEPQVFSITITFCEY